MLFFMFVILAGRAVRCDDASNYYVVEVPAEQSTARQQQKPFNVYWNVPTMQCSSKRIPFTKLFEKYGIVQNAGDSFRGDSVSILYDPGLFPALLKNESSGKYKFRNGGVPQEGNITKHLEAFRLTMEQSIPDVHFQGVGIIDFESWRPILRQNFGVLLPYKNVSVQIEKKLHWWWPDTWIQQEAKQRFEDAAMVFMKSTLTLAKQMRPKALWGYYGFPYCFNVATNNPGEACPANVVQENNQINWLWSESTSLYPSVYSSKNLTSKQLASLVRGRVTEASRVRRKGTPILPYFWFRYRDGGFMSELDLQTVLTTLYNSNASGFIIWGSSNDVNTVDKCNQLQNYVNDTLGPAIAKYAKYTPRLVYDTTTYSPDSGTETITIDTTWNDQFNDSYENISEATSTTNQPSLTFTGDSPIDSFAVKPYDDEIFLEPDVQRISSNKHNEDIVKDVEEELNKQSEHSTTPNIKNTNDLNENVLKEILLNILSNSKEYTKMDSNRDLASTENSASNNLYYTTLPFVYYISTSNHPVLKLDKTNPILDVNEETKILTLSDIISSRYSQNVDEADAKFVTTKSSYGNLNKSSMITNDIDNNNNEEINDKYSEFTTANVAFAHRGTTSTDNEYANKSTAQTEYMEYDSELTATQISSTPNDDLKNYTSELNVEVTRSSTESPDTDSCNFTVILDANDETPTETVLTTEEEKSFTKIIPNTTSTTNTPTNIPSSTSEDYDFFKLLHEGDDDEGLPSQETDNLPTTSENVACKDVTDTDLDEDVTVSTAENLEDEPSPNLNTSELTEESRTAFGLPTTSSPDKVSAGSAADGSGGTCMCALTLLMSAKYFM